MTAPVLPDQAELFCSDCLRFKARDQIVFVRKIPRGVKGQQLRYRCQTCHDAINRRTGRPRRGG